MPALFNFSLPPFDLLNEQQQAMMTEGLEIAYYSEGEAIILANDKPERLYIIHKGKVDEHLGDEHFALYTCDDFFDARSLFTGSSKHDYTCIEETITFELPAQLIKDIGTTSPSFTDWFRASLTDKHEHLHRRQQGQNLSEFLLTQVKPEYCEPAIMLDSDASLKEAVALMKEQNCDALLIMKKDVPGIITRTDLLEGIALSGRTLSDKAIGLATSPLITVKTGEFLFNAMILMTRHNIERIVVTDEQDEVIGLLPLTQLLSLFSTHSHVMSLRIQRAESLPALQICAQSLTPLIRNLHNNGVRIPFLMKLVSALNEQLMNRLFELQFSESIRDNICLMVMGSEGRGEQLVKTDQDNALITGDNWQPPGNFEKQLNEFSQHLQNLGYPPCPGHVMVNNPQWVQSVSQWRALINDYRNQGSMNQLLQLAIMLDARPICGNKQLYEDIESSIHQPQDSRSRLAAQFAMTTMQFNTPLNFLGDIKTSKHLVDIKKGGIFPIVHGVRSMALEFGLTSTSTIERLQWLKEHKKLEAAIADNLTEAFILFHRLKLDKLLQKDGQYNNRLDITRMPRNDRDLFRQSLHAVKKFKQRLWHHFHLERF